MHYVRVSISKPNSYTAICIFGVDGMIIKQNWQDYRDQLLPIIKQVEKRNDHKFSEEIDKALLNDRAFLFVGDDGFFVLQPIVREELTVNVMFAFNKGANAIDRYQPVIERLSQEIGAVGVELCTAVKGLIPILEQQGYTLTSGNKRIMHWSKRL